MIQPLALMISKGYLEKQKEDTKYAKVKKKKKKKRKQEKAFEEGGVEDAGGRQTSAVWLWEY